MADFGGEPPFIFVGPATSDTVQINPFESNRPPHHQVNITGLPATTLKKAGRWSISSAFLGFLSKWAMMRSGLLEDFCTNTIVLNSARGA